MFEFNTYYENFSLDNTSISLTVIIWAVCIGLGVGSVFYTLAKHASFSIVKALCRGEYYTAENAVSLSVLGVKPSPILKSNLKDGKTLRRYVMIANPDECRIEIKENLFHKVYKFFRREAVPQKYDITKARFYIPDSVKHTAEVRYETKGSPIIASVIACIIFLVLAVGLTLCMPKLLDLIDSMITAYKNL